MSQDYTKDPGATLDYCIDWTNWLGDDDTISASAWTVQAGLTSGSPSIANAKKAVIWLSAGTPLTKYRATNTIASAAGRIDERSIFVTIKER